MSDWDVTSVLSNLELTLSQKVATSEHMACTIDEATENDLAFCWYVGQKGLSYISGSKAGVILCKKEMQGPVHPNSKQFLVSTDNPWLTFVRVTKEMRRQERLIGISPRAVISEKSKIGTGPILATTR